MQVGQSGLSGKARVSMLAIMGRCGLNVLAGIVGVAAVAGIIAALPTIFSTLGGVWYGWAKILTHNYTSVVPATVTEWVSIAVTAWSLCVCVKLDNARDGRSIVFGVLSVCVFLLGVEVSNCALYAMTNAWDKLDGHAAWEVAGALTEYLNRAVTLVMLVLGVMTFILG